MSLRLKTILGVGLIEAILLVILITSILDYMRTSNEESMENYVLTSTELFAITTKDSILSFDLASLETFVEEVLKNQGLLYVRIIGVNGNELVSGGNQSYLGQPFMVDDSYQSVTDHVYDTRTPLTVDNVIYGHIEMGFSTERIETAIAKARQLAVTIALIKMILVAFFSFILGVYLTKQLKVLCVSAKQVAAGNLEQQINVASRDEVGDVAQSFNKMIEILKQSKKETEKYHDELIELNKNLEQRVACSAQEIIRQKRKLESVYGELSSAQQKISQLENYDQLTGFVNRECFISILEDRIASIDQQLTGAILLLSVDHFKRINDSIGSDNADQLLIEVGKRISHCVTDEEIIARPGSDTFLLILHEYSMNESETKMMSLSMGDTFLHEIALPLRMHNEVMYITASIGIALFDHTQDAKSVLRHAEYACHYAKNNGRDKASYFEEQMQSAVSKRFQLEQDLREAVENDDLFLVFQPQIKSEDKDRIACNSLEVLVRWIHPEEGFIPPNVFVEIAEESQFIVTLGNWIANNACKQIKAWEQRGVFFDHVAINISPIQFKQEDFVETITEIIQSHQLTPNRIMLEITEGVIIDNPDDIIEKIISLKERGIKISVDDFGTGYSSLGYLKRLPLDELKIDRSFIQEIENDYSDSVITEVVISMAKHFGYQVIAEGVETEAQKNILIEKGCYYFQGYFFSKPLLPEKIPPYLLSIQPHRYNKNICNTYGQPNVEN